MASAVKTDSAVSFVRFPDVNWSHAPKNKKRRRAGATDESWVIPEGFLKCSSAADVEAAVTAHWSDPRPPMKSVSVPPKYFSKRFVLWTHFPMHLDDSPWGPVMDAVGWYSVTPECIAIHAARRLAGLATAMRGSRECDEVPDAAPVNGHVILDLFCGCGGDAIAAARSDGIHHVIAVERDPIRLAAAAHNAVVYGVGSRLTFLLGDAVLLLCKALAAAKASQQLSGLQSPTLFVFIPTPPSPDPVVASAGGRDEHPRICAIEDIACTFASLHMPPKPSEGGRWLAISAVYLAPPWGGVDYRRVGDSQPASGASVGFSLSCDVCIESSFADELCALLAVSIPRVSSAAAAESAKPPPVATGSSNVNGACILSSALVLSRDVGVFLPRSALRAEILAEVSSASVIAADFFSRCGSPSAAAAHTESPSAPVVSIEELFLGGAQHPTGIMVYVSGLEQGLAAAVAPAECKDVSKAPVQVEPSSAVPVLPVTACARSTTTGTDRT